MNEKNESKLKRTQEKKGNWKTGKGKVLRKQRRMVPPKSFKGEQTVESEWGIVYGS